MKIWFLAPQCSFVQLGTRHRELSKKFAQIKFYRPLERAAGGYLILQVHSATKNFVPTPAKSSLILPGEICILGAMLLILLVFQTKGCAIVRASA